MIKLFYVVFVFYVFGCVSQDLLCDTLFLKNVVEVLASDSMEGRYPGTKGMDKAKRFLLTCFQKKTNTIIEKFFYNLDNLQICAENIVGIIDNNSDSNVVIMAHYDHIGLGGVKSRSLKNDKIHPGADDNASGVAAMLQLMNYLSEKFNLQKFFKKVNFIFIALSGHEDGLYGSRYFVEVNAEILQRTVMVINFDMIGRLNDNKPQIKIISNNVRKIKKYFLPFDEVRLNDDYSQYDILYFANMGIDCLSISTGIHDDYHKISDTFNKINFKGICQILNLVIFLIEYRFL